MNSIAKIILTIIITTAVAGGGTYYIVQSKADADKSTLQDQISSLNTKITALDPTYSWKTYTDKQTTIAFKYPADWQVPVSTTVGLPDSGPYAYKYQEIDLNGSNGNELIVSNFTDIRAAGYPNNLNLLLDLYAQRKITSSLATIPTDNTSGAFLLPIFNAKMTAATSPAYLETVDGIWRGIAFGADIAQGINCGDNPGKIGNDISGIIIITNGKDKVVEIDYGSLLSKIIPCGANNDETAYFNYIKSLSMSSTNEPFVKDYLTTYKNLALSIR